MKMRLRIMLFFAALNVLALASGFYVIDRLESARDARSEKTAQASARIASQQARSAPVPTAVRTVLVVQTNQFEWHQLESSDYRQYIANLRSVGCPEATIRDIIMTDVMRLYAQRRGQSSHNGRDFKYWETNEKRKLKQSQFEQNEKQLARIDRDLPAVLRELLGINYERELNKYFIDTSEDDRRLAFLSEDKRSQLATLRDQFEARRERVLAEAQSGALSSAQINAIKQIETERRQALDSILTPEEREQYELASSETADRLRAELIGFNPSEKEFREIFTRQQQLDAKYQYQDIQDESVRAAKAADQAKLEDDLKGILGESRMEEFTRSKDEEYRNIYSFAEQYDLPASTSENLIELRKIVETERQNLLSDPQIPADRLAMALKAMQFETEKQFRQTLGDKAYAAYAQGVGAWIQNMGN